MGKVVLKCWLVVSTVDEVPLYVFLIYILIFRASGESL